MIDDKETVVENHFIRNVEEKMILKWVDQEQDIILVAKVLISIEVVERDLTLVRQIIID